MLVQSVRPYLDFDGITHVYVVLKPNDPAQDLLPPKCITVEASDAYLGMGHSLAAAANHIISTPWLLVGLADMPWIQHNTIRQLSNRIKELKNAIIRPSYHGQPGHPVAFTANFIDDMKHLSGDIGAKNLLKQHGDQLINLQVSDPGVIRDVDSPNQLKH